MDKYEQIRDSLQINSSILLQLMVGLEDGENVGVPVGLLVVGAVESAKIPKQKKCNVSF